jgi:hypothetical protein
MSFGAALVAGLCSHEEKVKPLLCSFTQRSDDEQYFMPAGNIGAVSWSQMVRRSARKNRHLVVYRAISSARPFPRICSAWQKPSRAEDAEGNSILLAIALPDHLRRVSFRYV